MSLNQPELQALVTTTTAPARRPTPQPVLHQQLPLAISPARPATLDNFVVGDNAAVLAHLRQWLAAAAPVPPLVLWGPQASGKTHLLRGLAALAVQGADADAAGPAGPGSANIGWFTPTTPLPWLLQPHWVLVVLDGCEALDSATQHAAFVLFTEAWTHGVPFAAAARLPPSDLPLRDDLRTRLAWGTVFAVQPLSEADTRQALADEARRRGLDMPVEVENYLLSRFARDLSSLMQLLADLDAHGIAKQRRLTVPLVRDLMALTAAGTTLHTP